MAKRVFSRWEWRVFDGNFAAAAEKIRTYEGGNRKHSDEVYFVSELTENNVKLRENLIEVKVLTAVNPYGLEQWKPAFRAPFPLNAPELAKLSAYLGLPAFKPRRQYDAALFLSEMVRSSRLLQQVKVTKVREIYVINQCIVEIGCVTFNDKPHTTICVEHTEPERLEATVRQLGLDTGVNMSYITALKRLTNIDYCRSI